MSTGTTNLAKLDGHAGIVEGMSLLDPDDTRPPYQQVAASLRAAILTRSIEPGEKLHTQKELSERYGVARATVQQALKVLRDDGLVFSRQGSGTYARERPVQPVGLGAHLAEAFEADEIRIDFAGYSSETLNSALQEQFDKIRTGRVAPKSIHIRLLLADMTKPLILPMAVSGDPDESERSRVRMAEITARNSGAIGDTLAELAEFGLVPRANLETRSFGSAPVFKACIINGAHTFFGYYPVVEHEVSTDGKNIRIFDPLGKYTVLFHFADDGDSESEGSKFVAQTRRWFDSVWNTVATEGGVQ